MVMQQDDQIRLFIKKGGREAGRRKVFARLTLGSLPLDAAEAHLAEEIDQPSGFVAMIDMDGQCK